MAGRPLSRLGWRSALVAGLALVALAACSRSAEKLDPASAEEQIAAAVGDAVGLGVEQVRCPDDLPLERDESFSCDVVLADGAGTLPVTAVQRDDQGALRVVPGASVRSDADIADELRSSLGEAFDRSFQVDCGDGPPVVREPGAELTCRARDASSRRSVRVTVTDERGSLRFELGSG